MEIKEEYLDTIQAVLFEWKIEAKKRLEKEDDFAQHLLLTDKIQEVEEILETYFD